MRWWEGPASGLPPQSRVQKAGLPVEHSTGSRHPVLMLLALFLLISWVCAQTPTNAGATANSADPSMAAYPPDPLTSAASFLSIIPSQDSSNSSDLSTAPARLVPLPDSCTPFWKGGWPSPYTMVILSGSSIYDPTLHQTILSAGIDNWAPGSTPGAMAVLPLPASPSGGLSQVEQKGLPDIKNAQATAIRAQVLALNESRDYEIYASEWFSSFNNDTFSMTWAYVDTSIPITPTLRIYDTLTPKGIMGIPLRIRPGVTMNDALHYVPTSVLYAKDWQSTMQTSTDALHSGADGVNLAFAQAQSEADTLHAMGAGDPSYSGGAQGAWEDWQVFVAQSKRWSDENQPLPGLSPADNSSSSSAPSANGSSIPDNPALGGTLSHLPNALVVLANTLSPIPIPDLLPSGPPSVANGSEPTPTAPDLAPEQRYGRAYRSLHQLELTCASPPDLPDFSSNADLSSTFNDLAGDGDTTLWAVAWQKYSLLRAANAQMHWELKRNSTEATNLKKGADDALSSLRTQGSGNFSIPLPPQPGQPTGAAQPADVAGTIPEQAAEADTLLQQGAAEWGQAQFWDSADTRKDAPVLSPSSNPDSPGWASISLGYYARAIFDYQQSRMVAINAQEQMQSQTTLARSRAMSRLQDLQSNLSAAMATSPTGAAAAAQTRERALLSNVTAKINAGDAARGLGNQYTEYVQALALLNDAQAAMSNPQFNSDAYALNQTLVTYKALLAAGPGLNVDVSEAQSGYDNFYSSLLSGPLLPGAAELAAGQVQSLRETLRKAMSDDEAQYQALLSNAQALTPFAPSQSTDLVRAFALYRTSDGWSDVALEHPLVVRALLQTWQSKSDTLASKTLANMLCQNFHWEPSVLTPVAGTRLNAGGQWSSINTLNLGYNQSLSVDCAFPHPFLPSDQDGASDNVRAASVSGGKLHLLLSSLDAGAPVWVHYSSDQLPFALTQKSCLLTVDEQGRMDWQANDSLAAGYPTEHLVVNVPWPADSAGPSTLSWQGQDFAGAWSDSTTGNATIPSSSSPQVQFLLLSVPAGSQTFSIHITPDTPAILNTTSSSALLSSDGSMAVSYMLQIGQLPACSQALVHLSDGASGALSKISVQSSDAMVKVPVTTSADGRWYFIIQNIPPTGALTVHISYSTSDASTWFNTTLSDLRTQALALNDAASLDQLAQAESLYRSGSTGPAFALTRAVESRLQGEAGDGGASAHDWDAEAQSANQTVQAMQSLQQSMAAPSSSSARPLWAVSLSSWTSDLSTALDAATLQAQSGHFDAARSAWRKAAASFNQKALAAAQLDYTKLSDQLAAASAQLATTSASAPASANGGIAPSDSSATLSNASLSLSAARNALQLSDAPPALAALADAHQYMDAYGAQALVQAQSAATAQRQMAADLQAQSGATASQLQNYLDSLTALTSAGTSAFHPPLTAAQARTLLSQAQKAAPDPASFADPATMTDATKASATLAKQTSLLSKSNQTLEAASAQASSAQASIQSAAEQLSRMAQASVAQARQSVSAAPSNDASNAALTSLEADLTRLDGLTSAQQWPDAVVLGQSIVTRAKPLINPLPTSSTTPPWLLIGLTLLMLAGVAYVLLMRKPAEKKPSASEGGKKLERASGPGAQKKIEESNAKKPEPV